MNAFTVGDEYSWSITETDGVTPLPVTGVTLAQIAIAGPFATQALALAAGATSGLLFPATLTTGPATVSWITSVAGRNSATATTYPTGGWWCHQLVLTYTNGSWAKSRVFALNISDSIA